MISEDRNNVDKYVLIEVIERDISTPEFFHTYEEAYDKMCSYIAEVLDEAVDEIKESGMIEDYSAWAERYGNNFDWKIFKI